jgi:glycosyltransferase involved in cell wall biosynthesis
VKIPISVIIPVKNEAKNLPACLASVAFADEVWVVDSKSTDQTAAIVDAFGAHLVQFEYSGGFPKKKNWALGHLPLRHEWVLLLDADERVPPALAEEIREVLSRPRAIDGYYLNRRLIFLGRWIRHGGWYPSWNMRLFRHAQGRFEKIETQGVEDAGDVEVHEHVVLTGAAGYLKQDLLHEDFKSIYHFVERHNRYSNWEAQVYLDFAEGRAGGERQIKASLLGGPLERKRWLKQIWPRLPFRPAVRFIWMYLLRGGILDGRPGLIFCLLMSMHEVVIGAKLYELQLKRSSPSITKEELDAADRTGSS